MDHADNTNTNNANPTDPTTHRRAMLAGIGGLAAGAILAGKANAGPLAPPPGPISSTPGPEPRIPINSTNTPGSSNSSFIISQPGSYYLTGNINGTSGRNGLAITADNVTVDLMGYALIGVPGSSNGISVTSTRKNIHIRNGVVSGWGSIGVSAPSSSSRVTDIIAADNVSVGISTGPECSVTNSTASNNGGRGIQCSFECTVTGCSAIDNGSDGIVLNTGGLAADCVANSNEADGIQAGADCTIISCVARNNGARGIESNFSCTISHCTAVANGGFGIYNLNGNSSITDCTCRGNVEGGIRVFQSTLVRGNNCSGNSASGAAGILMSSTRNRVESNHCANNSIGIRSTSSQSMIFANSCSGNDTNWEIAASNHCWAPSMLPTAPINGSSGGGFSPFGGGTPDPLANFSH